MGVHTCDRDAETYNAWLLTTDVAAAGDAQILPEDIGKGQSIGGFLFTPDDAGALSGVDGFDVVDETGRLANFDARSDIFASVDGEAVGGDVLHGASNRLHLDRKQHALVGMSDLPVLTLAFEETLNPDNRSYEGVPLWIGRLAVELARQEAPGSGPGRPYSLHKDSTITEPCPCRCKPTRSRPSCASPSRTRR